VWCTYDSENVKAGPDLVMDSVWGRIHKSDCWHTLTGMPLGGEPARDDKPSTLQPVPTGKLPPGSQPITVQLRVR
jgi:hypothetical protein